jgi:hypothetical protein
MAPTTRGKKGMESSDLLDLINSSPLKKKAAEKKKAEAERRAAQAAKKAASKEKATKAKLIGAVPAPKPVTDEDIANYSAYDKKTAIILAKADSEIDYNDNKSNHYSALLAAFNHKKYPNEAVTVRARIKRYSKLVDDLRKGRARLLASAKLDKGKKKAVDFDPNPLISSGKSSYPSLYLPGPSPRESPSSLPVFFRRPFHPPFFLSFFYYPLFLCSPLRANFSFLAVHRTTISASRHSASCYSASAMRPRAFFFGFAPFPASRPFFGFAPTLLDPTQLRPYVPLTAVLPTCAPSSSLAPNPTSLFLRRSDEEDDDDDDDGSVGSVDPRDHLSSADEEGDEPLARVISGATTLSAEEPSDESAVESDA